MTLKGLVPWLPTAVGLFSLLTVYFFPKLRAWLARDTEPYVSMEAMEAIEEGRRYGVYGTSVQPGSVQYGEDDPRWHPDVDLWLAHDTSHAGGNARPASRSSGESDIDLDDNQSVARLVAQRLAEPSRQNYNINSLPRTFSDSGFLTQRFAGQEEGQLSTQQVRRAASTMWSRPQSPIQGSSSAIGGNTQDRRRTRSRVHSFATMSSAGPSPPLSDAGDYEQRPKLRPEPRNAGDVEHGLVPGNPSDGMNIVIVPTSSFAAK
jgi:hypothetical protein